MKRIIFFLAVIGLQAKAQNWDWARSIGSWAGETGFSISSDKFDNLYITGNSNYSTGGGGSFYYPMFWKLDKNGNALWQDTIWGDARVATDSIGNSYVACSDKVAKYNSAGQCLWIKTYPNMFFRPIAVNAQNGFVVIGTTKIGTVTTGCIYSCDANGSILWSYFNSTASPVFPQSVTLNTVGDIFIVGGSNPDPVTGNMGYFEHFNSSGTLVLHKSTPIMSGVACDSQKNIYLTGVYGGTVNINGNVFNSNPHLFQYVIKYDSQFNYLWHKFIYSDCLGVNPKIKVDVSDHANVTNSYYLYFSVDNYSYTVPPVPESFVANFDVSGNVSWLLTSTSPSSSNSGGVSINDLCTNKKGEVFVIGHVSEANRTFGTTVLNGGSNGDLLVAKISQPVVSSVSSLKKNDLSVSIYPNPSDGIITLCCSSIEKCMFTIKVVNASGQIIHTERTMHYGGELNKTIDLGRQAKGIYFAEIMLGSEKSVRKIVLE